MRNPDTTTVAPDVLQSIARLTALDVPGVYAMLAHGVGRRSDQGVHVKIDGNHVEMDLFLVLESGVNLRQVGHEVQAAVTRAIDEMVGMQPGRINIHIEDIYYPNS
ncbi:MAG: Asp23/Gls24 family envelope stress response protein [Anaerolineales bacterium]|nr:Asp23/Gls24 family envelope stress response protein [Anaerolineales bacterium]MCW5856245.1 Asp23/Gls24 family envelope stress response protein [Anaerolineales bacterium]